MDIRELRETDIHRAMELVWEVFSEFEAPEYSRQGVDEFRRFIAPEAILEKMRSGELRLWGCFDGVVIAGVIAAKCFDSDSEQTGLWRGSHISLLFVKKQYHRQGIARRLYEEAKQACACAREITVNSSPYAVEVYKRLGFVPVEDEKIMNGIRFTPMKHIL